LKIRQKIIVAPAFALAILILLLLYAGQTLKSQRDTTDQIVGQRNQALQSANALMQAFDKAHIQTYRVMFLAGKVDDKVMGRVMSELKDLQTQATKQSQATAASPDLDASGKARAAAVAAAFSAYVKKVAGAADMADIDLATASQMMQDADEDFRKLQQSAEAWIADEKTQIEAAVGMSHAAYHRSLGVGALLAAIAIIFSVVLSLTMARKITAPLSLALDVANRMAKGEIVAVPRVPENDESSALLNALSGTSDNLRVLVSRIGAVASEVSQASSEIAQGNSDLSQRTESTASALQQTAATVLQLNETVCSAAAGAVQASVRAEAARETAEESRIEVVRIVESMAAIMASSRKIGDITSVIDGIAFQTNILALNAAVEAARAGEQGRGFAVVAAEVRSLAQRSAAAAKDIAALIRGAGADVSTGNSLVASVGARTEVLVSGIREVAAAVAAIADSANAQSTGIREVNASIAAIENNTQQNAALVEQISANSLGLREQTDLLVKTVSAFRVTDQVQNPTAV
jgi:methyl-accepting chemotaxis protein